MSPSSPPDFFGILEVLATHDVEFILVGGLAAVVQGAPVVTMDVDIVHRRSDDNIARLLGALRQLDATYRHHPARVAPNQTHLEGPGHQLLTTSCGNLDVLGSIDAGRGFEELVGSTRTLELDGFTYHVLELGELIEVKARANRGKDRAVLPLLRNTLALREEE